jgi:hypothetical protein
MNHNYICHYQGHNFKPTGAFPANPLNAIWSGIFKVFLNKKWHKVYGRDYVDGVLILAEAGIYRLHKGVKPANFRQVTTYATGKTAIYNQRKVQIPDHYNVDTHPANKPILCKYVDHISYDGILRLEYQRTIGGVLYFKYWNKKRSKINEDRA